MAQIRQGDCCSLVGPSNSGKSMLLRLLKELDVRKLGISKGFGFPLFVFVDCLETSQSEASFYELLLRYILEELRRKNYILDAVRVLEAYYSALLKSKSNIEIRSLFSKSIRELLGQVESTMVILIFDEFDHPFRTLSPWPFRLLRALRDQLGTRLCFITSTSRELDRIRTDETTYEFRELFHLHTLFLHPLLEKDSRILISQYAKKHNDFLAQEIIDLITNLSGGHPGLIERVYSIAINSSRIMLSLSKQSVADNFSKEDLIKDECQRLWNDLEKEEREGLIALVQNQELDEVSRIVLYRKGLTNPQYRGGIRIFSPLFEAFLREQLNTMKKTKKEGVQCNFDTGQVWVDGEEKSFDLTENQRKFIFLLYRKAGSICTYNEIIEEVWGAEEGVSPAAISELVKRVRIKLESDWKNPKYILVARGEGYRLKVPE
ncbi:MAG: AAA family ATPase [Chloroflexi bacterium]|nr:AAA family ATPase [Chloroflexota bacterium]